MKDVNNFLRNELIRYIKEELTKGNSISDIRKTLLKAGHHQDLVKQAINNLEKHNFDILKALNEPIDENLKKELYFDVINSLVKYVEYQLEHGFQLQEIEKGLLDYGHSQSTILEAVNIVVHKEGKTKINMKVFGVTAIILILAVIVLSNSNEVSATKVILGLFPTLLTLIVSVWLISRVKVKHVLWAVPFLSLVVFFFIATIDSFYVFRNMDLRNLAIINLIISLFYVSIIILTSNKEE
ncbi:hypothetical protein HQ529_06540 [Candidatus Woesearchaeota archaeon]|nr:hypothetical protein [Candidatus Woesearchaeota archaeon]